MSVLLFVTTWCPDCGRARRTLQRLGVEFQEFDIESAVGAEQTMKSLNGGSGRVPTVVIETESGRTVLVEPDARELTDAVCSNKE